MSCLVVIAVAALAGHASIATFAATVTISIVVVSFVAFRSLSPFAPRKLRKSEALRRGAGQICYFRGAKGDELRLLRDQLNMSRAIAADPRDLVARAVADLAAPSSPLLA